MATRLSNFVIAFSYKRNGAIAVVRGRVNKVLLMGQLMVMALAIAVANFLIDDACNVNGHCTNK